MIPLVLNHLVLPLAQAAKSYFTPLLRSLLRESQLNFYTIPTPTNPPPTPLLPLLARFYDDPNDGTCSEFRWQPMFENWWKWTHSSRMLTNRKSKRSEMAQIQMA